MRQSRGSNIVLVLILSLLGMYLLFVGLSAFTKVEIIPVRTGMQAEIHGREAFPPFGNIDLHVDDLKQAVITTRKSYKGIIKYRVELVDYIGRHFPVTDYYNADYSSQEEIQNIINDSIKNRTGYTRTFRLSNVALFGFVLIVAPIMISIIVIVRKKRKIKRLKQEQQQIFF